MDMYFKYFEDLSFRELLSIYDSLVDRVYPAPYPLTDKKSIVLAIVKVESGYFDDKPKFFFEKDEVGAVKLLPFTTDCDEQKFAKSNHKINLTKILSVLTADSMATLIATVSDIDDSDMTTDVSSDESDENTQHDETIKPKVKMEDKKPSKSKIPIFTKNKRSASNPRKKSKIGEKAPVPKTKKTSGALKPAKYDSSLPIDSFLAQMEGYQQCSNLDETDLIKITLAQMMNDETGISIRRALKPAEMTNWEDFRTKLTQILGRSKEWFRHQLRTYQRGSETCGVALAKITDWFMQAYDRTMLSESERDMVIEFFINSMDNRLKQLLNREKSSLTYDNVASRAAELERSMTSIQPQDSVFSSIDKSFLEDQINMLRSEMKSAMTSGSQKKKEEKNPRKRVDVKKMSGHCISYSKNKKCRFGSDCKYIHSDAPPSEVMKALQMEA
jgi:hypothetical protein